MRWMRSCKTWLLTVILLVLASACWRGTVASTPAPVVTVTERCLRSPMPAPPPSWIETLSSAPASEVEVMLWARIEQLELWAAQAWALCGGAR